MAHSAFAQAQAAFEQEALTESLLGELPMLNQLCDLQHCLNRDLLEAAVPQTYPTTTAFAFAATITWMLFAAAVLAPGRGK